MPPANRRRASPPPEDGDAYPPAEGEQDARVVRVRVLRQGDVARAQQIFSDGMRGLSPEVVRAGLLHGSGSWKVWLLSVAVGALAAGWTVYSSPAPSSPPPHVSFWLAAARSGFIAAITFLTAYAIYLSTIMDKYVKESLEGDMFDPWLHYHCDALEREAEAAAAAGGKKKAKGGDNSASNHSCFWVAELVDPPAGSQGPAAARPAAESNGNLEQQQQQQPQQPPKKTLRRRLLGLAGALAENERRVKEDEAADAAAMLAPTPSSALAASSAIVGCVGLEHKPGEGRAELRRMSVDEAARGRGAAVALARALEAHARERGLRAVFCTTSSVQPAAMALYGKRLGWDDIGAVQDERAKSSGVTFHKYEKRF